MALLSKGAYTYDLAVAEVDPKKCAVCYTCPRLCPHSAITVGNIWRKKRLCHPRSGGDTKWGAAKVDPACCYGCGICVAECPAKAITLHHLTDAQIYAADGVDGITTVKFQIQSQINFKAQMAKLFWILNLDIHLILGL